MQDEPDGLVMQDYMSLAAISLADLHNLRMSGRYRGQGISMNAVRRIGGGGWDVGGTSMDTEAARSVQLAKKQAV
jgi:hypothetical protein